MKEKKLIDANAFMLELKEIKSCLVNVPKYGKVRAETIDFIAKHLSAMPTIDPETLRPVAHWEEIPDSYRSYIGEKGSWCVPATRCTNPECREINPCGLKTPFCPMCGFRMEDVPHD